MPCHRISGVQACAMDPVAFDVAAGVHVLVVDGGVPAAPFPSPHAIARGRRGGSSCSGRRGSSRRSRQHGAGVIRRLQGRRRRWLIPIIGRREQLISCCSAGPNGLAAGSVESCASECLVRRGSPGRARAAWSVDTRYGLAALGYRTLDRLWKGPLWGFIRRARLLALGIVWTRIAGQVGLADGRAAGGHRRVHGPGRSVCSRELRNLGVTSRIAGRHRLAN